MLGALWTYLRSGDERRLTRRQRDIEEYLSKSVDLVDLERRQRELDRKGAYRWL